METQFGDQLSRGEITQAAQEILKKEYYSSPEGKAHLEAIGELPPANQPAQTVNADTEMQQE